MKLQISKKYVNAKQIEIEVFEITTQKNDDLSCNHCDKKYKTMLRLSKHVDTKPETFLTTTKVKCENCSETFHTDELLTRHN